MKLKGVTITVNYPDDECEAAVPEAITMDQLIHCLRKLADTEPEMTSFVIVASVDRSPEA